MKAPGEGKHERHDVIANVVVVNVTSVRDFDFAVDKGLVVVPCPWSSLGTCDPSEFCGALENLRAESKPIGTW